MSGMPFFDALLLLASVAVLIAATQLRHFHPFLVLVLVASAFGLAAGLSISLLVGTLVSDFLKRSTLRDW